IVIATTVNATDDPIAVLAQRLGVGLYRGSEHDVVQRVTEAHRAAASDLVVQLTGDCPLIDPDVIDQLVRLYAANRFDYASNVVTRSYPIGMDTQVSSRAILERSLELASSTEEHEHLYKTIYERPQEFGIFQLVAPPELIRPELRLTLDTEADLRIICAVFEALYPQGPEFRTADILKLLRERSDLPWLSGRGEPLRR
ncbi:MAG: cytidylyltransferase domain-containing protein, partial [Allosphingosinicella sp.]